MADATADFFEDLGRRGHEPLLEKATGSVRVDLADGKHLEHWLVVIDKGDIAVSRKQARADLVVRADKALFDKVAKGRENAFAAVLRGAVGIEGKVQLMMLFQRLFPSPPKRRSR
jgi:putative sterol carrier protein